MPTERFIIVNITENGIGQFWGDVEANTAEAVQKYLNTRQGGSGHLEHARAGGRFMVGRAADSVMSHIRPTTVRFYNVTLQPVVAFTVTPA